ncbi:glycosyl transferase group 1 : Glycosyl transferase group 1 OS=Desulfovibrio sp. X2 GN=dsx2_1181 PE=4 SV=1: Glyco_trans_4_4: Glycos_transf_1 [Gemmataceae bacterium]|nr:glycosyl transferase group 1 : Glycosyl transferase group 1 OS=Desulfovibrio sp. X2 GN=dsx2_1181 PE=4 SV=1: Glyco_trans_4_4: Glycos_transf_1 [Gemmataceae bacterium]VTT98278.1 glycosyl transferase group 1 : Glycosyl transferase group 1 OS=Desulfovibrio sp. X2 GN=dsx2_1181 PE=4 SV=1: Glyco_trans_4_4: Glycos_transf_1 [Gemmataceae bacterium]
MSALLAPRRPSVIALPAPVAEPVKVCFMIDRLSRAGTESQLLALVRELDRTRVQPSLVLLDGEDDLSRALEPADCPVIRLGVRKLLSVSATRAAARLRSFWREQRPDVLQTYFLDAAYFGAPLAKACGIKRVVRVQNNLGYWLTGKHRVLGRCVRPFVDAMLTNTDAGKQALVERERHRGDRVVVLENGVDTARFNRFMFPDTSKPRVRVGCVANLRPVKNIDGLMRAAKSALERFPRLTFDVAGDGEQRPELERLHAELGLGDRFKLRGSVTDVAGFLRTVDVAVLPSHSEGMSNALLEYMSAGRAVIATDVGANAQVLRHGKDGLIVPAGDSEALVGALGQMLENPMRAAAFGSSARRRVEAEYSRDAMCRRFEAFYRTITSN